MALYGPKRNRWAMTERGREAVEIAPDVFHLHRSALSWDGSALTIDVNETTAPFPQALRGQVRVEPDFINDEAFAIDAFGRHRWRPIAPSARVAVRFERPDLAWTGRAYLDTNAGDEPIENAFQYWDWSRAELADGETAIFYNTDLWSGDARSLALHFGRHGALERVAPPSVAELPATPLWRVKRRTRADSEARVVKTFEDTPFYSRSLIEGRMIGQPCRAMHESLSGERLRSMIVKAMLPFRMPRLTR